MSTILVIDLLFVLSRDAIANLKSTKNDSEAQEEYQSDDESKTTNNLK